MDSILPPPDPSVSVVVFEPLPHVAAQIEEVARRHVVAAAVSDRSGLSVMTMYNDHGLSSSLADVSYRDARWNSGRDTDGKRVIVPCVALQDVLAAIPAAVRIWVLKTDMQGLDFRAVQSAGRLIRRVPYLVTEVSHDNVHAYDGSSNVRMYETVCV